MTGKSGLLLSIACANTPRPVSVTHRSLIKTGVLFRPQLGERLLKIKPDSCVSPAGLVSQYRRIMSVMSSDASSRPVSRGLFILPVSCTGGRGIESPASTSGQTGTNSKSGASCSRIIRLAFD